MTYLWVFLGCYAYAFVSVNIRINVEMAGMKTRAMEMGFPAEKFDAAFRKEMPLATDILVRIWSPFVWSVIPTGLLSLGYFLFS